MNYLNKLSGTCKICRVELLRSTQTQFRAQSYLVDMRFDIGIDSGSHLGIDTINYEIIYNFAYIIYIAMFVGTSLGLISKYIMDKMYIFKYSISNLYDYSKNFSAYVLTGIFTTLIFWSFEYLFYILFNNEIAIYLGAIIGLSIGYTVKYKLDKNFVFK